MKRMSGSAKRHRDRALAVLCAVQVVALTPSPLSKAALRYELFAVSNHSGGTGGGHYQPRVALPFEQKRAAMSARLASMYSLRNGSQ